FSRVPAASPIPDREFRVQRKRASSEGTAALLPSGLALETRPLSSMPGPSVEQGFRAHRTRAERLVPLLERLDVGVVRRLDLLERERAVLRIVRLLPEHERRPDVERGEVRRGPWLAF